MALASSSPPMIQNISKPRSASMERRRSERDLLALNFASADRSMMVPYNSPKGRGNRAPSKSAWREARCHSRPAGIAYDFGIGWEERNRLVTRARNYG